MPLGTLHEALGLLIPPLAHPQIGEPHQWVHPVAPIPALECLNRVEQLRLGVRPPSERNQDPAVVRLAGGSDEVLPNDVTICQPQPLLGPPDVARVLTGAQQPAIDLSHGAVAGDLARRHRGHRLVEQLHAFTHAPRRNMGLAKQSQRLELEISVTEPPGDGERRSGAFLALGGVARERSPVQDQPAVGGALLDRFQNALGSAHPSARDREVAVKRAVEEGKAAGGIGRPPPACR